MRKQNDSEKRVQLPSAIAQQFQAARTDSPDKAPRSVSTSAIGLASIVSVTTLVMSLLGYGVGLAGHGFLVARTAFDEAVGTPVSRLGAETNR